jgi:hypothetical protein
MLTNKMSYLIQPYSQIKLLTRLPRVIAEMVSEYFGYVQRFGHFPIYLTDNAQAALLPDGNIMSWKADVQ